MLVTFLYLLFSVFITPAALNKSRLLLGNDKITSFIPTIRVQQFSDSFSGITFIVDEKEANQIKNIFLQDSSNILKNISSVNNNTNLNTVIANSGIVEDKSMTLFKGQVISTNKITQENEIIKFDQLKIDLGNIQSTAIKKPKIQETSTLKLIACVNNNFFNDKNCNDNLVKEILLLIEEFNNNKINFFIHACVIKIDKNCNDNLVKEILPNLNRRIVMPFFIPVISLIASFLLINSKIKFFIIIYQYFYILFLFYCIQKQLLDTLV